MIPSFFRLQRLETTGSTNEDVKKRAIIGEPEGLVITSRLQTAGKGRMGRRWTSPEGNLYASFLLRPESRVQDVGVYSFIAALAAQATVQKFLPQAEVKLKWPNDVLVAGKKISGLLLEVSGGQGGHLEWLVIGVGINIASFPEDTPYPATSLAAEGGGEIGVEAVLEAFLTFFDHWRLTLRHDGFWPVRRAWLARAQNGPLQVRQGETVWQGTFSGIDEAGRLILRLPDGSEKLIDSGDVFLS